MSIKRTFQSDYIIGRLKESIYLPVFQDVFNDPTIEQTIKTHIFDYQGEHKLIELKTRQFEHNKYPDTMIGLNKIQYAQQHSDTNIYFCFSFEDGLYYWKYTSEDKLNFRKGGRKDRGYNEYKQYCYIPINLLKPLKNNI